MLIQKQGSSITLFLTFQERLESRNVSNETKPDDKLTEYNKRNKTRQESH